MKLRSLLKTASVMAVLLLAALTASADNITVDGKSRSYLVYAPQNLGEGRPLFIFCHGRDQDANYMLNTQFRDTQNPGRKISIEAVCDTAKFVIVFPNGINRSWDISGNSDINFVKALIDKMATQYKIDRNRVYLGGFSMGGMFTYHAMNKIPDLIAAFVPVSGYPLGGATANANVRPLPIMHIHGTGDDMCGFNGVQPALNVWIKHNGCPTTAKVVNNYNGFNAKLHTWAPGNDGVEVKLLELAGKGHWVCKEPQVYTGKEMWNFCKNYSLNRTKPSVSITSHKSGHVYTCFAPQGTTTYPDITITADADDPNGTISKVEIYDGSTLLATCTAKPYKATLTGVRAGSRTLKVVATDNDGETASVSVSMTLSAITQTLSLSQKFTENASVPAGWTTFDSSEKRVGFSNGYTNGCRVMQMTGNPRGFNYGFYFRNISGSRHEGWIKYGLAEGGSTVCLFPGHYVLKYKACNWNRETPTPLEFAIESSNGQAVATTTYTPTVNVGNSASNSFSGVTEQQFEFDITTQGEYVLAVYADASGWSDGLVGQLILSAVSYGTTGVEAVRPSTALTEIYDLQGRRLTRLPQKGIYIQNGKKHIR